MKKGDILLIVLAALFLVLWLIPGESGDTVSVWVDGKLYKEVSLGENTEIKVESEYGKNTVIIEDGKVYIKNADCPDRLCEKESLSGTGRSIVCLPNRLSVKIESKKQKEEIDVII